MQIFARQTRTLGLVIATVIIAPVARAQGPRISQGKRFTMASVQGYGGHRDKPPADLHRLLSQRVTLGARIDKAVAAHCDPATVDRPNALLRAMAALSSATPSGKAIDGALAAMPYLARMRVKADDRQALARRLSEGAVDKKGAETLLRETFVAIADGRKQLRHDTVYDVDLSVPGPRDQGSFFSCWAITTVNKAEIDQGRGAKFSYRHNYGHYLLSRMIEHLQDPTRDRFVWERHVPEVGEFWKGVALARHYGLVWDEAFADQRDFEQRDIAEALVAAVNAVFSRHYERRDAISGGDTDALSRITAESRGALVRAVADHVGPLLPPDAVLADGKTPRQLGGARFPVNRTLTRIIIDKAWEHRDEPHYPDRETLRLFNADGSFADVEVRTELKLRPVAEVVAFVDRTLSAAEADPTRGGLRTFFISYNHPATTQGRAYVDRDSGLMTVGENVAAPRRKSRHAVTLAGLERDFYGETIAWKLLNSLGTGFGDQGFNHMDRAFIDNYLFDINY